MTSGSKHLTSLTAAFILFVALLSVFILHERAVHQPDKIGKDKLREKMKKARWEYFNRMLKDPVTGAVPVNIRQKELRAALKLNKNTQNLRTAAFEYEWREAGPVDVGGRTRALAIDQRNSNIVLAGGVSGGMWKSIDKGKTWDLKSDPKSNQSVTSIVQDPNNPDTWYYTMGEFRGGTESATGALFQGAGIFKSIDNGEVWTLITYMEQASDDIWEASDGFLNDPISFTSPFDFVSKIVLSPITGSLFIASNFYGIYRSTDGGATFENVLESSASVSHYDVLVDSSGLVSATFGGLKIESSGLHISNNDGNSWTNFTPSLFPDESERSVLAFAPSNQFLIYMLTNTGNMVSEREDVRFYRFDMSDSSVTDLTNNLPQFGGASGDFTTQNNYNMIVSVKPDDENVVLVGGTNLFRSTDAFNTIANNENENWIGGYKNKESFFLYPNHHPDQHVIAWDPENPDTLWNGNDGGIYKTNITNPSVVWEDLNRGYRVTQFYTAALSHDDGDFNLIGGTQDNGSPFFTYDFENDTTGPSSDLSSGDGAFCYIGNDYLYVSFQNGNVHRLTKDGIFNEIVSPDVDTLGVLFIHPYTIEPVLEEIMYYPSDNHLLINEKIKESNVQDFWIVKENVVSSEYIITALSASTDPPGILYLAAYDDSSTPKVLKYTHATGDIVDISIPGAEVGAYPHHIAVNAEDADEFIVVFTNYNIIGTYHTDDGGQNYASIEGNLEGDDDNPGPSVRAAAIINRDGKKQYYLGTSTGLYLTDFLENGSTVWNQESENKIGYVVISALAWREIDDAILAATHGRGAFLGVPTGYFILKAPIADLAEEVTDTSFVAKWNATEHAITYALKIADDPEMSNLLDGVPEGGFEVDGTSVLLFNLPGNRKFYYTVEGVNEDRRSPASNIVEIETLFPAPVAELPTNVTGFEFTARWSKVIEAEFYVLDVATDSMFTNYLSGYEKLEVSDTMVLVDGTEEHTIYYYRVSAAKQTRNNDSKFSNIVPLTTPELTGIEDGVFDFQVDFYPVPSHDYLIISTHEIRMKRILITNISGKIIRQLKPQSNEFILNVSDWKPGVYIARLESESAQIIKKFIVE